jgi:hypothetical protein
MKNLNQLLAVLFLLSALFAISCNEDEEELEQDSEQAFTQGMRAKVDGQDWSADNYQIIMSPAPEYGVMFSLSGMSSDGQLIVIDLDYSGAGTYEFGDLNAGAYTPDQDGSLTFTTNIPVSDIGELSISNINMEDSVASGTFDFTAICVATENSVVITEGEFKDIPIKQEADENLPEDNYFSVNVNGVAWTPHTITGASSGMTNTISINSSSSQSSEAIGLSLNADITPGTYNLSSMTYPTALYNLDSYSYTVLNNGSVTVTEHDTENNWIEGTFHFTSTHDGNTYNLTNGTFGVTY